MHRVLPLLILSICSTSILPLVFALPSIAHQEQSSNNVGAMIHLDPNDSPYAGKPTLTWFMLTQRHGKMIALSSCNCRVTVYDSRQQAIAQQLTLSTIALEGHQKGHQGIRTTITFPKPGAYTVVLSGQAKNKSFESFEFKFPVMVRP